MMKKRYLYFLGFILLSLNSFGQGGTDVIFWIDNSGSINSYEYSHMKSSVDSIMKKVLACNTKNKVTVIQYGAQMITSNPRTFNPKIRIESDFTDSVINYERASRINLGDYDFAHESLGLIGKALDHIPDPNILHTTTLNRTPGNKLAIYLFTDAIRDDLNGSCLVNKDFIQIGSDLAFENYTSFKTTRDATFIVTMVPSGWDSVVPGTDSNAKRAGAAISSGSRAGTYILNMIESYPLDPDGPGSLPRLFLYKNIFLLSPVEIDAISDQLCSIQETECIPHLIMTSPIDDVHAPIQDNQQASISITASNRINSEAVGIYHAGKTIVMLPGFYSQSGSRFRAYIEDCSNRFIGRGLAQKQLFEEKSNKPYNKISLYPNPANQKVTIENNELIKSLQILSIDGKLILDEEINTNHYELDVSNYKNGIYIIITKTKSGNILSSKLIKD